MKKTQILTLMLAVLMTSASCGAGIPVPHLNY